MSCIVYADTKDFYIEKEVSTEPLPATHHHRSYELYYLVRGEREYFIEDRFYVVREGDLVFIPREVFHRTAGDGGLRFLVHFTDSFLHKFFTDATLQSLLQGIPSVFRGNARDRDTIAGLLESLLLAYMGTDRELSAQDEALLSGYLHQLLFIAVHGTNAYSPHADSDERITRIIQYINENYSHITDITLLVTILNLEREHLNSFP